MGPMCIGGGDQQYDLGGQERASAPGGQYPANGERASKDKVSAISQERERQRWEGVSRPRNGPLAAQRTDSRANQCEPRPALPSRSVPHRRQEHLLWTPVCGSRQQGHCGRRASHWPRARRRGRSTKGSTPWEINGDPGKLCQEGLKMHFDVRFPSAAGSSPGQSRPAKGVLFGVRTLPVSVSQIASVIIWRYPSPFPSPEKAYLCSVRTCHHVPASHRERRFRVSGAIGVTLPDAATF